MVLRGHVEGQTVVLEEPSGLPDGTPVQVEVLANSEPKPVTDASQTLYEQLRGIIGLVSDLPSDLAENHDFYLHGTPKK